MRTRIGLMMCLSVLVPTLASAQDAGQAGITMGYPASIGLLYHVTDRVAVRPEFSVSRNTGSSSSPIITTISSGWSLGVGASALFYLSERDRVRPYVSPRFTYTRSSSTVDSSGSLPPPSGATTHGDAYSAAGSFGAQYTPNRRFAVFGDVGFGYTHTTLKTGGGALDSNSWGTRTGAGVVFYF
jgi:hypothetical protein